MRHGFLNIAKPTACTSHDVVNAVRRCMGQRRVRHAGTLDPLATGVLVLGVGHGTRLIEYLADTRKTYRAVILLGRTTTTDDSAGETLRERPVNVGDGCRAHCLESVQRRHRADAASLRCRARSWYTRVCAGAAG